MSASEGFCDCEALVVAMLNAMADAEEANFGKPSATPTRWALLRSAALAVSVGQHRTDAYDPDELARAHQRAANTPEKASRGGKASAARMTPEERSERARKAGLKGGAARAAKRTPEQRKEQATAAATARWAKEP